MPTQLATLGGGCFWCLEAVFERLRGVRDVRSGYAGGHVPDPSYREVCGGRTGHAEVVQVEFDPGEISYRDLLDVFFTIHDPTTPDRQGGDQGPQYRSIILCHDAEQRAEAERAIEQLEGAGRFDDPIVTEVVSLEEFFPAEDDHQGYYRANSSQPYCRIVIDPKLAKLAEKHADKLDPS
jgi:peptide-methionine (S)-S-oxide reductase